MCPAEHLQAASERMHQLVEELTRQQQADGRWIFCFESGPMTDAYMLLLYEIFGTGKKEFREGIAGRLLSLSDNGIWRLYPDEKKGSISATMEASFALVAAGFKDPSDPLIQNSQAFVREQGGVAATGSLTKVMLTLVGQFNWPDLEPQVPIKVFLLPWWFPISFFDFVGFTRCHAAPIVLASHRKFSRRLPRGPRNVTPWNGEAGGRDVTPFTGLERKIDELLPYPPPSISGGGMDQLAEERGIRFILDRVEPDGTLYSYFSTTFLMIFSLMAVGYPRNHPVLQRAMSGLEGFLYPVKGGLHLQETTSAVWDTALITYALQEAGVPADTAVIRKGCNYLLSRQHS
ncbi:squalene--hopene cyclase, partial [Desmospora sp. 8437]